MEEVTIIAAPPVSVDEQRKLHILDYTPPPGGVHADCCRCHNLVWIGRKQDALRTANPTIEIICYGCMFKNVKANNVDEFVIKNLGGTGGKYKVDEYLAGKAKASGKPPLSP